MITVNSSFGGYTTGEVSVTEDGLEVARVPLMFDTAYLTLPAPALGPRTFTVTYLGSADVLGSTTTVTVDVGPSVLPYPLAGTMTTGGTTSTIGSGMLTASGVLYDPLTGYITTDVPHVDLHPLGRRRRVRAGDGHLPAVPGRHLRPRVDHRHRRLLCGERGPEHRPHHGGAGSPGTPAATA